MKKKTPVKQRFMPTVMRALAKNLKRIKKK